MKIRHDMRRIPRATPPPRTARRIANARKAFFRAFLDANDLLIAPGDNDKPRDLSDAERQLVKDAARLSLGIERSRLHKELPGF